MKTQLSKSRYVLGRQCPKALWLSLHRRDLKPVLDEATLARFELGHEIGRLAQSVFPDGLEISADYRDIAAAEQLTREAIFNGADTLYEATTIHPLDGSHARTDILHRVPGTDVWDLIEVKSSTGVKAYYLDDAALQYHVFRHAGYLINSCSVMVIDNTYVRDGDIDPVRLFRLIDITDKILERLREVEMLVPTLVATLQQPTEPEASIGARCNSPFECDFKHYCWQDVPAYSVYNIFDARKVDHIVAELGSPRIEDLPEDRIPASKSVDVKAWKTGNVHIDAEQVRDFLDDLQYPLYFLDYETVGPAIPLYDGTRPYEAIPFQFSLHIQHSPESALQHHAFLHQAPSDPRRAFTEALISLCGDTGSIIVYNQPFEAGCNNRLADRLPEFAPALRAINARMQDLLIPFQRRWLYAPSQKGSASIKAVLPAFTDLGYDNMNIADGMTAARQYQAFAEGRLTEDESQALMQDLLRYCEMDTYAMVVLLKVLRDAGSGRLG